MSKRLFIYKLIRLYVYGGMDLKDGLFGDMWKLNLDFYKSGPLTEGANFPNRAWEKVVIGGKNPSKLAYHSGVLQEFTKEFIIYGGSTGIESSDTIYVVDLKTFKFNAILAAQQKEINGKALPGPRDEFALISFIGEQDRAKPVYLIGGFKNGSKMNDVYRLIQAGVTFTWELLPVAPTSLSPNPRSSFGACLASDTSFYLFGGSGDNNVRYNDMWEFNGTQWTLLSAGNTIEDEPSEIPLQKSGHQVTLYKGKHILVFGGIHEVTYEMNDLKIFNVMTKKWTTVYEENKNGSDGGSPKNKSMIQNDSHRKNMFKGGHTLNLDTSINNNVSSPKGGDQSAHGVTSPMNRFNNNPFLTIKHRSLSATKRMEQTLHMESHKESEAELLTPTSISMKNTFIIKNADASFDQYAHMMKKRKSPHVSPNKLNTANIQFAPNNANGQGAKSDDSKIRLVFEKQPPGRDGHSACLYGDKWVIFGGDRH